jgi:hypothetical protein
MEIRRADLLAASENQYQKRTSSTEGAFMGVPQMMESLEAIVGVFIAGTWYWVLHQRNIYLGWRQRASIFSLALASVSS